MSKAFHISTHYSITDMEKTVRGRNFHLSDAQQKAISKCRAYLENEIRSGQSTLYGINTGFGALCDVQISDEELTDLQLNLLRSHACGTGEMVDTEIVRIMMLLKILSLSYGYSGVRLELIDQLITLFNLDVMPVIYTQGSLGASGDLAPLAHLGLMLIGEGEVIYQGEIKRSADVLHRLDIRPISLASKEGLALLNGTQFSTAHALWACLQFENLFQIAHETACLSIEAFNCSPAPFDPLIHRVRNQAGQQESAARIRKLLQGSDIGFRKRYNVQDPYSFRCIPQVLGASWDAYLFVRDMVTREINGVTDNPNVFVDEDKILSGGNFHAQPIAYACDLLAIAASEIGSISERRTYQLLNGFRDLPMFLTRHAGKHSGLMIPQYTAASIVSQNKQLCTPASIDSISSSAGQEDHVSMAANAATKLVRVIHNLHTILAIEWMTAAQAMEFRSQYRLNIDLEERLKAYRKDYVPPLDQDRILYPDIQKTVDFLSKHQRDSHHDRSA